MLVRRHPERALVDLGDLAETRLEVALRLVLHAPVLDEAREVVAAVLAGRPAEVVDILVEGEGTRGGERVSESALDFGLEDVQTHTIDRVLETSVLKRITLELRAGDGRRDNVHFTAAQKRR